MVVDMDKIELLKKGVIESNNILSHIKNNSYTIALDLHGKQLSSEEFSLKIVKNQLDTIYQKGI